MFDTLNIIVFPDPRLRKVSQPIGTVTAELRTLAERMLELMRLHKGVGLAAPQVGQNIRLFVMNATGDPADDRVYLNPVLSLSEGSATDEEGCLSLPEIRVAVNRSETMVLDATDLDNNPIHESASGYVARVWQHEMDHLNGIMIIDRMGLGDQFKHRKALREMEEKYATDHPRIALAAAPKPKARRRSR